MSFPEGSIVNDGVKDPWCLLFYATETNAACGLTAYGRGARLIKLDIRNAYRVVPLHPDDRWLIGMIWAGLLFISMALPFDL